MSLTPEQIEAGWVEHDGGPCPVPLDSRPEVMFRSRLVHGPGRGSAASYGDCWRHGDYARYIDIIAYRPEPKP